MTIAPVPPPVAPSTGTSRRTLLLTFRSSAVATVVTYGVNLAIVPFVLHRVGADLYGAWATLASVLAVGALADAGVRTEIIRRVGAAQGDGGHDELIRTVQQGTTLLMMFAGVIVAVGVFATPVIRAFAFPGGVPGYSGRELDLLMRAIVAVLATSLVANGYFGVLRGVQRGDVETTGMLLAVPMSAAATVTGVSLGWGLWGLFLGSLATLVVTVAWNATYAGRLLPDLRFRPVALRSSAAKGYLALSSLALLSQIGDVVDSQWDKVVLSHFVGSSAVASFQIGTNLVLQGKVLALLPIAPVLVLIAELRRHDRARMEAAFQLMARASMALGTVVLSSIFVFAPAFIRLWLGADTATAGAAHAARLFAIAVALNLASAPLALRAFGEGWHRIAAASAVSNMALNGTLSLLLTMAMGFDGALLGSICGNLAGTLVLLVMMRRRLGDRWVPPPWKALTLGSAGTLLMVGTGADSPHGWLPLVIVGFAYAVVLTAACGAAEALPFREVKSMLHVRP